MSPEHTVVFGEENPCSVCPRAGPCCGTAAHHCDYEDREGPVLLIMRTEKDYVVLRRTTSCWDKLDLQWVSGDSTHVSAALWPSQFYKRGFNAAASQTCIGIVNYQWRAVPWINLPFLFGSISTSFFFKENKHHGMFWAVLLHSSNKFYHHPEINV